MLFRVFKRIKAIARRLIWLLASPLLAHIRRKHKLVWRLLVAFHLVTVKHFRFQDLHDDVIIELVGYLPLEERIKLERVNKRMAAVVGKHWKSIRRIDEDEVIATGSKLSEKFNKRVVTDDAMMSVFLRCPNIKHMCLRWLQQSKFDAVTISNMLIEKCPRLESFCSGLDVVTSKRMGAVVFRNYLKQHPANQVRSVAFDMSKCKVSQMSEVIDMMPNLDSLAITFRVRYKDDSEEFLNKMAKLMSKCGSRLSNLVLHNVKDTMLNVFIDHCPNLNRLHLKDTYELKEQSIRRIGDVMNELADIDIETKLHYIKHLIGLQHVDTVSWMDRYEMPLESDFEAEEAAIQFWKWSRSSLHTLHLYLPFSSRLGARSFKELARYCSQLQRLELSFLGYSSDDSNLVAQLVSNLKHLSFLAVAGVTFSDDDITKIFTECPALRSVSLYRPQNIEATFKKMVKMYAERHPKRYMRMSIESHERDYMQATWNFLRTTLVIQMTDAVNANYVSDEDQLSVVSASDTEWESSSGEEEEVEAKQSDIAQD